jgi:hypothetical protein
MKKKRFIERVQLLNDGRQHYLEFLRNLTSQVVILVAIVVMVGNLYSGRVTFDNRTALKFITDESIYTLIMNVSFWITFSTFALAAYANTTLFHNKCFSQLFKWGRRTYRIIQGKYLFGVGLWIFIFEVFKRRLVEVLEYYYAITIIILIQVIFVLQGFRIAYDILERSG